MPEIRITPGGFITAKPRHMIGLHGASPFISSPFTIEGFKNLVNYYGDLAWPILNSSADTIQNSVLGFGPRTNFLGNDTQGAQDQIDMTQQQVMSSVLWETRDDNVNYYTLNNNGELIWSSDNTIQRPTVAAEKFTTVGTITVAAGNIIVTGAGGTAWTTDVLTGPYGLTPSLNKIYFGDILRVQVAANRFISFRITGVINNNQLGIWPTPQAGNPAIGVGLSYSIWRTGYNSKSRVISFNIAGQDYFYYCGNLNHNSATNYPYGTIQCANLNLAGTLLHFMAPQTTDSAGVAVADIQADDLIYYKGFIIYGAGPGVSWSAPGAPNTLPFATTDFPAKNISVVDAASKFVSFEYLGDQVVAFFEDSTWLVSATGSVPEFSFYKLPELESILNPGNPDPSGGAGGGFLVTNCGRPSTSGRGAIYYISNRGVESMGGGLSNEVSAPVSSAIRSQFGPHPLYVAWDNAQDCVLVRSAMFHADHPSAMYLNVKNSEWSTLLFAPPAGESLLGLTPSIQSKPRTADHTRLIHLAYYETLPAGGTLGTNGANVRSITGLIDENTPTTGLVAWEWLTPVLPMGLQYSEFSLGGFILDAYSLNTLPVTVTWTLYGGSSPYNLVARDTNTLNMAGTLPSPWVSSRQRLAKKVDDPFLMFKLSSTAWIGISGLTLFESQTQAMR